jgi:hypothetical protein
VWTDTAAIGGENNLLTKYHEDTGRAVYNYLCASRNLLASLHGFIHPPGSCDLCCNFCFSLLLFQMHEPVPALRSVLPSVGRPPPACSITSNHRSIARRTFTETRFWRHLLLPLFKSQGSGPAGTTENTPTVVCWKRWLDSSAAPLGIVMGTHDL